MKITYANPALARWEIICGIGWFFSDGFWLIEARYPCYAAGIVACIAAVVIFFYIEREPVPLIVCCADTSWLFFNTVWSFSDLMNWPPGTAIAKGFFVFGILLFLAALAVGKGRKPLDLVLRRVRLGNLWPR